MGSRRVRDRWQGIDAGGFWRVRLNALRKRVGGSGGWDDCDALLVASCDVEVAVPRKLLDVAAVISIYAITC